MQGVFKTKLKPCYSDDLRTTTELLNGQLDIRNVKLLKVNGGTKVGGHSHPYFEAKYLLAGRARYTVTCQGLIEQFDFLEGELLIMAPHIVHTAEFPIYSVLLDFSEVGFISSDLNNEFVR